jgi:hypothetical protein
MTDHVDVLGHGLLMAGRYLSERAAAPCRLQISSVRLDLEQSPPAPEILRQLVCAAHLRVGPVIARTSPPLHLVVAVSVEMRRAFASLFSRTAMSEHPLLADTVIQALATRTGLEISGQLRPARGAHPPMTVPVMLYDQWSVVLEQVLGPFQQPCTQFVWGTLDASSSLGHCIVHAALAADHPLPSLAGERRLDA